MRHFELLDDVSKNVIGFTISQNNRTQERVKSIFEVHKEQKNRSFQGFAVVKHGSGNVRGKIATSLCSSSKLVFSEIIAGKIDGLGPQ